MILHLYASRYFFQILKNGQSIIRSGELFHTNTCTLHLLLCHFRLYASSVTTTVPITASTAHIIMQRIWPHMWPKCEESPVIDTRSRAPPDRRRLRSSLRERETPELGRDYRTPPPRPQLPVGRRVLFITPPGSPDVCRFVKVFVAICGDAKGTNSLTKYGLFVPGVQSRAPARGRGREEQARSAERAATRSSATPVVA